MNFVTSNVVLGLSAVLAVSTAASNAQAANYSVEARATTGTMPGAGATYSSLIGETSTHALHDPAALQWTYNINQQLYSDAAAESWTELGSLVGHVYALAQRVKATNFPPGVTASTMGRFTDRFQVVSATLPANTPVTLTFHNVMSVDWTGSGLYEGSVSCLVQVNGYNGTSKWSAAYNKAETTTVAAPIVVKTTVGAVLTINGRLDISSRSWFFVPGPSYNGTVQVDATCDSPYIGADKDVQLVTESGFDYATL